MNKNAFSNSFDFIGYLPSSTIKSSSFCDKIQIDRIILNKSEIKKQKHKPNSNVEI